MSTITQREYYEDQHGNAAAIVQWGRAFYVCYQPRQAAYGCGGNWSCGGGVGNNAVAAVKGLLHGPDGAERSARMLLRDARAELADAGYTLQ